MGSDDELPEGTSIRELTPIADHRGRLVELDRVSWHPEQTSLQWVLSTYVPGVLRGLHLHKAHTDRLVVIDGELVTGLVDLRRDSATAGLRASFTLAAQRVLTIPPGVLHGFFAAGPTTILNATSHEYDPTDDFEVRFDDADLGLDSPTRHPTLSERDRDAPPLAATLERCLAAGMLVIDAPR